MSSLQELNDDFVVMKQKIGHRKVSLVENFLLKSVETSGLKKNITD